MKSEQRARYTTLESPLGVIVIAAHRDLVSGVRIITVDGRFAPEPKWVRDDAGLRDAREQFEAYFAGELRQFTFAKAKAKTPFLRRVSSRASQIPYGQTTTYAAIAQSVGVPGGSRAVGLAMARNPWTIAVPCHRVIASDGSLRGYLNGLPVKRSLLAFERHIGSDLAPGDFWSDQRHLMTRVNGRRSSLFESVV